MSPGKWTKKILPDQQKGTVGNKTLGSPFRPRATPPKGTNQPKECLGAHLTLLVAQLTAFHSGTKTLELEPKNLGHNFRRPGVSKRKRRYVPRSPWEPKRGIFRARSRGVINLEKTQGTNAREFARPRRKVRLRGHNPYMRGSSRQEVLASGEGLTQKK